MLELMWAVGLTSGGRLGVGDSMRFRGVEPCIKGLKRSRATQRWWRWLTGNSDQTRACFLTVLRRDTALRAAAVPQRGRVSR